MDPPTKLQQKIVVFYHCIDVRGGRSPSRNRRGRRSDSAASRARAATQRLRCQTRTATSSSLVARASFPSWWSLLQFGDVLGQMTFL